MERNSSATTSLDPTLALRFEMKSKMLQILRDEPDAAMRFEVLDRFYEYADSEEDILFLISVLNHDADPCVRHEAAAQLYRILEKKEGLFTSHSREIVVEALFDRARHDDSTVVKHESIESLAYLVDQEQLHQLEAFTISEDADISATARISSKIARSRIENGIAASSIGQFYLTNWESPTAEG